MVNVYIAGVPLRIGHDTPCRVVRGQEEIENTTTRLSERPGLSADRLILQSEPIQDPGPLLRK